MIIFVILHHKYLHSSLNKLTSSYLQHYICGGSLEIKFLSIKAGVVRISPSRALYVQRGINYWKLINQLTCILCLVL